MRIIAPDYYREFHCIADKCRHSCCIGWEIDIDADHPWVKAFAKEDYTTPAWYSLIQTAHCEHADVPDPVIQAIDNTERCQRLCLLWAQEGVPHAAFRLWENAEDAAVQAFAAALLEALG